MNLDILKECKEAKRIGISGHIRPDGDCVGSVLGLQMYLRKCIPGAEVKVFLEKPADIFRAGQRSGKTGRGRKIFQGGEKNNKYRPSYQQFRQRKFELY